MSKVNQALFATAETVISNLGLNESDLDEIQAMIIDNMLPLDDFELVTHFFQQNWQNR